MFTDSSIKSLKPRKYRYRLTEDFGRRGIGRLVLDISVTGKKAFYFQYYRRRDNRSRPVLIRIGLYKESHKSPGYKLNEARDKALEYSELLKRGIDIKDHLAEHQRLEEQKLRKIELEKRQGDFGQLIDSYLAFMEISGKRTYTRVSKSFNAYVLKPFPEMSKRKANQIEANDIRIIIGTMLDNGITTQCNRVRSHLHAAFQHGLKSDHDPRSYTPEKVRFNLKYNPVAFIPKQSDFERVGEHVISQEEIAIIWKELPQTSQMAGFAVQLAFATGGQRIGELLRIPKTDIDLREDLLTIDHNISKNRTDHQIPLVGDTKNIVKELMLATGDSIYLFPGKRGRTIAKDIHTSSSSIGHWIRGFTKSRKDIRHFTARDIRRTIKTEMGKAGLDKEIRDRLQNHALNDVSSKDYDRYDYLIEKREALKVWHNHLELLINPSKNVAQFRSKNVS